ncbi:MAG: tagatose-6-phosphate ketose isomerase [Bacillales bacterium]|jgi:tagatose-6-phosphate ketose/aldose isomerase|nr:tagatose-6-phosphate ketose isomerase [Bacillales bacterium]
MIFENNSDQLKEIGAIYTATEIAQQPRLWLETVSIIESQLDEINSFMERNVKSDTRIILTGAGTSDYVGATIADHLSKILSKIVEAIPTTDIVSNPFDYVDKNVPTVLVSFARSGNSPESVGAFDLLNKLENIHHIVITCNDKGALAERVKEGKQHLLVLMPSDSNDKGFAMTGSFTCMLLAAVLIFDIAQFKENKKYTEIIASQGENIIENGWAHVKQICSKNPSRIIYLGSGFLRKLAQELMLKNLELTNGTIMAMAESVLGFRHGPKTFINDETVVIVLVSQHPYTQLYDADLIKEIFNDKGEHQIIVLDYQKNPMYQTICNQYYSIGGKEVPAVFTALNYVLYGQMIGLYNSIRLGITPDNPVPSGAVNRVVQGVTIHPYK